MQGWLKTCKTSLNGRKNISNHESEVLFYQTLDFYRNNYTFLIWNEAGKLIPELKFKLNNQFVLFSSKPWSPDQRLSVFYIFLKRSHCIKTAKTIKFDAITND